MFLVLFRRELPWEETFRFWEMLWACEALAQEPLKVRPAAPRRAWAAAGCCTPHAQPSGGSQAPSDLRARALPARRLSTAHPSTHTAQVHCAAALFEAHRRTLLQFETCDELVTFVNGIPGEIDVPQLCRDAYSIWRHVGEGRGGGRGVCGCVGFSGGSQELKLA
jgi:hypothetical protein